MLPEKNLCIYFDNNATTRLLPEIREELHTLIDTPYGNPSSPNSYSDFSRKILLKSREMISHFLKCFPDQIIFTSGASESNTMILNSVLNYSNKNKCIITTPSEHASVKENCRYYESLGIKIKILGIDSNGLIDISELASFIEEYKPSLVSIGWASNETGVIQPIEEISKICRNFDTLFHTDASQFIGRGEINLNSTQVDFLTFSGHKLHAPQGIGGLFIRNPGTFHSLIRGGEQEHGLRSGTENVIGISGLGKAIEIRMSNFEKTIVKLTELRNYFESSIKNMISDVIINGYGVDRTPNTSNIMFIGVDGQALMAQLDIAGVICSQTSACTSMIPEPSETLRAMGLSVEEAFSSLRFSFAVDNTFEEIDQACLLIKEKVEVIRNFYALRGVV